MENIAQFKLSETIALLERTPAVFNAFLRGLPDTWTQRNEGGDTWSAFDVIGHLIHGERADWMPRVRVILENGEARTFVRFDRLGHISEGSGKSLEQLLDELARLRQENLAALQALDLQPQDLGRRGRASRPGSSDSRRTARDLGSPRSNSLTPVV